MIRHALQPFLGPAPSPLAARRRVARAFSASPRSVGRAPTRRAGYYYLINVVERALLPARVAGYRSAAPRGARARRATTVLPAGCEPDAVTGPEPRARLGPRARRWRCGYRDRSALSSRVSQSRCTRDRGDRAELHLVCVSGSRARCAQLRQAELPHRRRRRIGVKSRSPTQRCGARPWLWARQRDLRDRRGRVGVRAGERQPESESTCFFHHLIGLGGRNELAIFIYEAQKPE